MIQFDAIFLALFFVQVNFRVIRLGIFVDIDWLAVQHLIDLVRITDEHFPVEESFTLSL